MGRNESFFKLRMRMTILQSKSDQKNLTLTKSCIFFYVHNHLRVKLLFKACLSSKTRCFILLLPRDEAEPETNAPWEVLEQPLHTVSQNFAGFDQSLVDNVAELTKVVTSNTLKVDIEDFLPVQILVPKIATTRELFLTSSLDHEQYPVNLEVKFFGQKPQISLSSMKMIKNNTDLTLSVYVHSSNPHWLKVNEVTTSLRPKCQNPFEQSVKLTEILPGKSYFLPLALSKGSKIYLKSKDIRSVKSNLCKNQTILLGVL